MPSLEDIREYQNIVAQRFPTLDGVWFVMDGLRLSIQKPNVGPIQSKFYSGWKKEHTVNNVFCFCPGGTIIAAAINAPGCVHDSNLAFMGRVYDKLHDQYELCGGKGVVDQAFASSLFPFLIKSGKEEDIPTDAPPEIVQQNREAIYLRQSAEWGMRAIQSSFPRLYDKLPYEEFSERRLLLRSVVHLYNFRTRYVGRNQIQSVFVPYMERFNEQMRSQWIQDHNINEDN